MRSVWPLMLCLGACHASLADQDNPGQPDASAGTDASVADDARTVSDGAPQDSAPLCVQAQSVYLNFDGVTLTRGATSNAATNTASWMTIATGTAPPYRNGAGNRAAVIANVTTGITNALAPYGVSVVTTRPTMGPYMMIVFGGAANQVGSNFGGAVQQLDCANTNPSDVAWVSDAVQPNQLVINYALGAIGFGLGLTATTSPADCMCGWDNACQQNGAQCTFSASIARDPGANQLCAGVTTQNEQQALLDGFCP